MKYILPVLAILSLFSCSIQKEKEIEPNNQKWKSQSLDLPIHITGKIDEKDIDYFKIVIPESTTNLIDIKLITKKANPLKISLYYQNKFIKSTYLLKPAYQENKNNITFKNILVKQGIYYIKIQKKYSDIDSIKYNLQIDVVKNKKELEKEPNDHLVNANYINITNGYIKGFYNPSWNIANKEDSYRETDWYKFSTSDNSNTLSIEITSIPGIDPVIVLYNNLGFPLKKADSMGIDEPEILKNFGIFEHGEYYIKIYSKQKGIQNDKIPYQLYLNLDKIDPFFEQEPNDSMNKANRISDQINGYINPKADIDWYCIQVTNVKSLINISITPLNSVDLNILIYNQIGEKIYTLNYTSKNHAEVIPNLLLNKGKYYLSVSDTSHKNQNYLDHYTLMIKQREYQQNWEYEPNNTVASAKEIHINHSYNGYISPDKDVDYFKFTLDDETNLKIDISPVPEINFIIEIHDTQKNLIKNINTRAKGEGESETVILQAGTYYIILKNADNKSNFYENYILSLYER